MGTVCVTPSPESSTIPVVRPEAYSESTAWMATYLFCFFRNRGSEKEVSASFFPSPFSPPPPLSFFPSLDLFQNSHRGHVEGLEHDLRHLLAVGLGVERRLGQQDRVLLGRDAELVVEGVVPDLLLLFDCFFF